MKTSRVIMGLASSRSITKLSLFAIGILVIGQAGVAEASGKSKLGSSPTGAQLALSYPNPIRLVVVKDVGTKAFQMPNGNHAEIGMDLNAIFATAITKTDVLRPLLTEGDPSDECGQHLEVRAAVSSFVLDLWKLKLSIGYTPSGDSHSDLSGVNGVAEARVGMIAVDFGLYSCNKKGCQQIGAATANHKMLSSGSLSFQLDFANGVNSGPTLIRNTPLEGWIREIMVKGMQNLVKSFEMNRVGWWTTVRSWDKDAGEGWIAGGVENGIAPSQMFEIYAVSDAGGVCDVWEPIAYVHTIDVHQVSSHAVIDKVLSSRNVQEGDVVMIRPRQQ